MLLYVGKWKEIVGLAAASQTAWLALPDPSPYLGPFAPAHPHSALPFLGLSLWVSESLSGLQLLKPSLLFSLYLCPPYEDLSFQTLGLASVVISQHFRIPSPCARVPHVAWGCILAPMKNKRGGVGSGGVPPKPPIPSFLLPL